MFTRREGGIAIVGGGFPCIDRIQLFLFLPLGNPIVKLFIDRHGIIGIAVCTHVAFALVLAIYNSSVCHLTRMGDDWKSQWRKSR